MKEKVHQELMQIYGMKTPKSAPVKYDDVHSMVYLDCVIKETMRLFPAAVIFGRQLTEDFKLGIFTFNYKWNIQMRKKFSLNWCRDQQEKESTKKCVAKMLLDIFICFFIFIIQVHFTSIYTFSYINPDK